MRNLTLILVSGLVLGAAALRAEEREEDQHQRQVFRSESASEAKESTGPLAYRLRFGDPLRIETSSGGQVRGRLEYFDGDRLRIDGRSFTLSHGEVRQIEARVDDSVGNGGLIGMGIGTAAALATCAALGGDCEFLIILGPMYAGAGAGFGVLVDALHQGHQVVYVAPGVPSQKKITLSPILTRDQRGVLVSFAF